MISREDVFDIEEILNTGFGSLDPTLRFQLHYNDNTTTVHVYYDDLHIFNWQYTTRVWNKQDLLTHFSFEFLDSGKFDNQLRRIAP